MCFLVYWRGKGRDVNNKTGSQSKPRLSNRLGPKPHPRVHEHTSSQSRTQGQAPANTHRLNTDFTFTVSGGMKNFTNRFSAHSSKSRALFSHQRTQLSWTLEVLTDLQQSLQNCHLIHPHLNCKLQTSQISRRGQPQPSTRPASAQAKASLSHFLHIPALQNLRRQRMPVSQICVHYFQSQGLDTATKEGNWIIIEVEVTVTLVKQTNKSKAKPIKQPQGQKKKKKITEAAA